MLNSVHVLSSVIFGSFLTYSPVPATCAWGSCERGFVRMMCVNIVVILYIYRSNDSSNTDHSQTARSELNAASNSKSSPWANHTSSFSFCKKPTRIAKALQVSCFQHLWTNEIEANSRTSRPLPDKQRRVCIGCLAV